MLLRVDGNESVDRLKDVCLKYATCKISSAGWNFPMKLFIKE